MGRVKDGESRTGQEELGVSCKSEKFSALETRMHVAEVPGWSLLAGLGTPATLGPWPGLQLWRGREGSWLVACQLRVLFL